MLPLPLDCAVALRASAAVAVRWSWRPRCGLRATAPPSTALRRSAAGGRHVRRSERCRFPLRVAEPAEEAAAFGAPSSSQCGPAVAVVVWSRSWWPVAVSAAPCATLRGPLAAGFASARTTVPRPPWDPVAVAGAVCWSQRAARSMYRARRAWCWLPARSARRHCFGLVLPPPPPSRAAPWAAGDVANGFPGGPTSAAASSDGLAKNQTPA